MIRTKMLQPIQLACSHRVQQLLQISTHSPAFNMRCMGIQWFTSIRAEQTHSKYLISDEQNIGVKWTVVL